MSQDATLTSSTPVLMADDYARSKAFYVDVLGFSVAEEGGTPARFGIFKRGSAVLFVDSWHGGRQPKPEAWDAYLHTDNIASLLQEFEKAGASVSKPLHSTVYGMDEFEITDPDGNVLCFGCDSEPESAP